MNLTTLNALRSIDIWGQTANLTRIFYQYMGSNSQSDAYIKKQKRDIAIFETLYIRWKLTLGCEVYRSFHPLITQLIWLSHIHSSRQEGSIVWNNYTQSELLLRLRYGKTDIEVWGNLDLENATHKIRKQKNSIWENRHPLSSRDLSILWVKQPIWCIY